RRTRRGSPSPSVRLPFAGTTELKHVWTLWRPAQRALGGRRKRQARARLSSRPAEPGARLLRPVSFGLGRKRLHLARPQGPRCGRGRRWHGLGRGGEPRRLPARPARPGAPGGVVKTPVTLVTGFLGSGKTTLISRLLAHPDLGETAVIVNELGEVGIDHHL